MKKQFIIILIAIALIIGSCGITNQTDFISQSHRPIVFDGTRIYGGMATNALVYASTLTDSYGPLCYNPTCTHERNDTACEARPAKTIQGITYDGKNIILIGRDPVDLFTSSIWQINTETGKKKYILKQYPNTINATMVVRGNVYFLTQINSDEHVVCYLPLDGGDVEQINLPSDEDYYFVGADENYLYLECLYSRKILAVDYNNGYEYHTLYTFEKDESTYCYIDGTTIYCFSDCENRSVTATNDTEHHVESADITNEYPLGVISKYNLETGSMISKTDERFVPNPTGFIHNNRLYMPHFAPEYVGTRKSSSGDRTIQSIHMCPGIDIVDLETMTVIETVDLPGISIDSIIHADEDKIVYYGKRYEDMLNYYMEWYNRNTGETHEYNIFWDEQ